MLKRLSIFAMAALLAGFGQAAEANAPHPGMSVPRMPAHGFRDVPPGFHGPHIGVAPVHPGNHFGTFHGHDFGHMTANERDHWQHGGWHHGWRHGHYGWWWSVDDLWFYYPAPIYPYPAYVGPDAYYDYSNEYTPSGYYWYHCDDPEGYYPYVKRCNVPWQAVPPTP